MASVKYSNAKTFHAIEGVSLVRVSFIRDGDAPFVEICYNEGYYETDDNGDAVLNNVGQPKWVSQGDGWTRAVPFSDPEIQALAVKHSLDIMGLDDKIVALTNEYMENNVFKGTKKQ